MKKIILLILFIPVFVVSFSLIIFLLGILLNLIKHIPFGVIQREIQASPWWYDILKAAVSTGGSFYFSSKVYPFENKYPALTILTLLFVISIWSFIAKASQFPEVMQTLTLDSKISIISSLIGFIAGSVLIWYSVIKDRGRLLED